MTMNPDLCKLCGEDVYDCRCYDNPSVETLARSSDPWTSHYTSGDHSDVAAKVLECLGDHPKGLTSRELANVTGIDLVSVSPILKPLERQGLVRRFGTRPNPGTGKPATIWFQTSHAPVISTVFGVPIDEIEI